MMRVVHISTHDITGGAARAAFRLHTALLEAAVDSTMFVRDKASSLPSVVQYKPSGIVTRLRERIRFGRIQAAMEPYRATRPPHLEDFDDDRSPHVSALRQLPPCDIVHLHFISAFIDHGSFFHGLPRHLPVVWTVHDMAPLTGGCHYDNGCSGYLRACGNCPQLGSCVDRDLSRAIWLRKKAALETVRTRLHFVATSKWNESEIRRSSLTNESPVSLIPYGLDTQTFSPKDRVSCKQALGIAPDRRVVLFVSDAVDNPRKGMKFLIEAIQQLQDIDNLLLLSIGRNAPPPIANVAVRHLGAVNNDTFLSIAYSAADVFVIPSVQEMFGQTALEALACGTPAVGFDVGGIPDVISNGDNGLLAAVADTTSLAFALRRLLLNLNLRIAANAAARRSAVEQFCSTAYAQRHISLYQSLPLIARTRTLRAAPRRETDITT